jgi:2-C-methyl-D-erythritol 2,4-cyclodiphosphate synthase
VADRIRKRLAELLVISPRDVGVKAKTPEGMGTDNAAIAHVVVLLEKHEDERELEEAAVLDVEQHVDEVVQDLVSDVKIPSRKKK